MAQNKQNHVENAKTLLDAVSQMVKANNESLSFNTKKKGIIKVLNGDGTANVQINGDIFTNIKINAGLAPTVNEVVFVEIPNNEMKFAYIATASASSSTGGTGTVTNVSSANSDISITNPTTTPQLTLNSANTGASKIVKYDTNGQIPASSVAIADAGGVITASNVETALQEIIGTGRTTETIKGNSDKIGVLSSLATTVKTALVGAINEIVTNITNHLADLTAHGVDKQNVLRQSIINSNFSINQRAVSGTVTLSAGQYGHDRWKAGSSGCTYTFATTANITTITISAGSLQQVIEGINLYTGTYTLSWVGTVQGKIGAGSYSASGISGSITGGTNTTIEFNTGTLSKVQFNFGSIALPYIPKNVDEELRLCQRYLFCIGNTASLSGYKCTVYTANDLYFNASMPINMRITPTIINNTETTYWSVNAVNSAAYTGFTLSIQNKNLNSLVLKASKTSHGADSTVYLSPNSNLFGFDAEL